MCFTLRIIKRASDAAANLRSTFQSAAVNSTLILNTSLAIIWNCRRIVIDDDRPAHPPPLQMNVSISPLPSWFADLYYFLGCRKWQMCLRDLELPSSLLFARTVGFLTLRQKGWKPRSRRGIHLTTSATVTPFFCYNFTENSDGGKSAQLAGKLRNMIQENKEVTRILGFWPADTYIGWNYKNVNVTLWWSYLFNQNYWFEAMCRVIHIIDVRFWWNQIVVRLKILWSGVYISDGSQRLK